MSETNVNERMRLDERLWWAGTEAFPTNGGTLAADGASNGDVLPGSVAGVRFDHPYGVTFYLETRDVGDAAGNASLPGWGGAR